MPPVVLADGRAAEWGNHEQLIGAAGFRVDAVLGIEGPGWLVEERWADPEQREGVLYAARAIEQERSLLGLSAHLLAVATAA